MAIYGGNVLSTTLADISKAQQYTKTQGNTTVNLTDAVSILIDGSLSNKFKVTLAGNRTLANPTNLKDATYIVTIKQDNSGNKTLDYDTLYRFPDGIKPTLSTTPNAIDELYCNSDGSVLRCVLNKNFITPLGVIVPPEGGGTNLTYVSDGDTNGLLYWLGTNEGTTSWSNPQSIGKAILTTSSTNFGAFSSLSDRSTGDFGTNHETNSFVKIEIVGDTKLACNYYSIRGLNNTSYQLRNWKLEGGNDNLSWTTLNTQTNNTSLDSPNEWVSLPVTTAGAYKFFRIIQTGVNSGGSLEFGLSEIELYGTVS